MSASNPAMKKMFAEFGFGEENPQSESNGDSRRKGMKTATPPDWIGKNPPLMEWVVDQMLPRGEITVLVGDGGSGKTDIALQLAENCARSADHWLGHAIMPGPVLLVSAEESIGGIWRRIDQHGRRNGFRLEDLARLHIWSADIDPKEIADTALATSDQRTGRLNATKLFEELRVTSAALAPILVIIDNTAATFAGNMNDRAVVRAFVNLLRALAWGPGRPAVMLLDHPSQSGLKNGTGHAGSVDWRNGPRGRLFLELPVTDEEARRGLRILRSVKCNDGPMIAPIALQWRDHGFEVQAPRSPLQVLRIEQEAEETFLTLLDTFIAQGRYVSALPCNTYAPAVFARLQPEFKRDAFRAAMERLFAKGVIVNAEHGGRGKKARHHIERANCSGSE